MTNERVSSVGEPKFSTFISTRAAEASSPTTAGRSPLNTDSTTGCFWYFKKNLLMVSIRMNDGNTTANVANVADGHNVRELLGREPVVARHHLALYHREHGIAPAEAEKAYLEEGVEELKKNHRFR